MSSKGYGCSDPTRHAEGEAFRTAKLLRAFAGNALAFASDEPVVFGMRAYPESDERFALRNLDGQCPPGKANPRGPEATHGLELKGRMFGIHLEQFKILVCLLAYMRGKRIVAFPECFRCVVFQSGRVR